MNFKMLFTWQLLILALLSSTKGASLRNIEDSLRELVNLIDAVIPTKSSAQPTETTNKPNHHKPWGNDDNDGMDVVNHWKLEKSSSHVDSSYSDKAIVQELMDLVETESPSFSLRDTEDKGISSFVSKNIGEDSKADVIIPETELRKNSVSDLGLIPQGGNIVFQDLENSDKEEVKKFNVAPSSTIRTTITTFPGITTDESNYSFGSVKNSPGKSLKPSPLYKPIVTGFSTQTHRIQKFPLIRSKMVRDKNFNQETNPDGFRVPTKNLQLELPYQIPFPYVRRPTDELAQSSIGESQRESRSTRSKRNSGEEEIQTEQLNPEPENRNVEIGDVTKDENEQPMRTSPAEALDRLKFLVDKIVRELSQYKQKFTLRLIRMTEREDLKQMPDIMKDFEISPEKPIFFVTGGLKLNQSDGEQTTTTTTTTPTTTTTTENPETTESTASTSSSVTEPELSTIDKSTPMTVETSTIVSAERSSDEEEYASESTDLTRDNSQMKRKKRSYVNFEDVELPSTYFSVAGRMARTEDPFEEYEPGTLYYEIIPQEENPQEVRELVSHTRPNYELVHQSQPHLRDEDVQNLRIININPSVIQTNSDIPEPAEPSEISYKPLESNLDTSNLINLPSPSTETLALVASENLLVDSLQQTVADASQTTNIFVDANEKPALLSSSPTDINVNLALSDQELHGLTDVVEQEAGNEKINPSESIQSNLQINKDSQIGEAAPLPLLTTVQIQESKVPLDVPVSEPAQIAGSSVSVNILTSDSNTAAEVNGPITTAQVTSDTTDFQSLPITVQKVELGQGQSLPEVPNLLLDTSSPIVQNQDNVSALIKDQNVPSFETVNAPQLEDVGNADTLVHTQTNVPDLDIQTPMLDNAPISVLTAPVPIEPHEIQPAKETVQFTSDSPASTVSNTFVELTPIPDKVPISAAPIVEVVLDSQPENSVLSAATVQNVPSLEIDTSSIPENLNSGPVSLSISGFQPIEISPATSPATGDQFPMEVNTDHIPSSSVELVSSPAAVSSLEIGNAPSLELVPEVLNSQSKLTVEDKEPIHPLQAISLNSGPSPILPSDEKVFEQPIPHLSETAHPEVIDQNSGSNNDPILEPTILHETVYSDPIPFPPNSVPDLEITQSPPNLVGSLLTLTADIPKEPLMTLIPVNVPVEVVQNLQTPQATLTVSLDNNNANPISLDLELGLNHDGKIPAAELSISLDSETLPKPFIEEPVQPIQIVTATETYHIFKPPVDFNTQDSILEHASLPIVAIPVPELEIAQSNIVATPLALAELINTSPANVVLNPETSYTSPIENEHIFVEPVTEAKPLEQINNMVTTDVLTKPGKISLDSPTGSVDTLIQPGFTDAITNSNPPIAVSSQGNSVNGESTNSLLTPITTLPNLDVKEQSQQEPLTIKLEPSVSHLNPEKTFKEPVAAVETKIITSPILFPIKLTNSPINEFASVPVSLESSSNIPERLNNQISPIDLIKESMIHPTSNNGPNYYNGPKIIVGPTSQTTFEISSRHKQQFLHSFFPTLRQEPIS